MSEEKRKEAIGVLSGGNGMQSENKQAQDKSLPDRLSDPALVIALVSALLYVIIVIYYVYYFDNLSLPYTSIRFPYSFYLFTIGGSVVYFLLFLLVNYALFLMVYTYLNKKEENGNSSGRDTIIIFTLFLIAIFIYDILYKQIFLNLYMLIYFICFYLFSILWVVLSLIIWDKFKKLSNEKKLSDRDSKLIFISIQIIVISLIVSMFISFIGANASKELIKGHQGYEIQFIPINNSDQFTNRTFMLITYNDNKYYVVDKNSSLSGSLQGRGFPFLWPQKIQTKLYIIKDDQIRSATITKINWQPNIVEELKSILFAKAGNLFAKAGNMKQELKSILFVKAGKYFPNI